MDMHICMYTWTYARYTIYSDYACGMCVAIRGESTPECSEPCHNIITINNNSYTHELIILININ